MPTITLTVSTEVATKIQALVDFARPGRTIKETIVEVYRDWLRTVAQQKAQQQVVVEEPPAIT